VDLLRPRLERRGPARSSSTRTAGRSRPGDVPAATWPRASSPSGCGGAAAASRASSSSCATSRARWSATRGCLLRLRPGAGPDERGATESFVFGTRLTRVTRLMKDRDRDRALARVADSVTDWAGRDSDRRVVPRVQPQVGTPDAPDERRRDRRVRRLGSRRSGTRRRRDCPPAPQLPPPRVAQPARVRAGVPAARRGDEGGLPVHRRLPACRHARLARAAGRGARGVEPGNRAARVGRNPCDERHAVARPVRADVAPPRVVETPHQDAERARPLR
jgi:hypothetical protein